MAICASNCSGGHSTSYPDGVFPNIVAESEGTNTTVYWPQMTAGNIALTKVQTGQLVDDNIVVSLSNAVNAEIQRYNDNPRYTAAGTAVPYSGGSKLEESKYTNLQNTTANESIWQQIVLKTNSLIDAHSFTGEKININDYKKSDGSDLISANNINYIIDTLLGLSGHINDQQCKCNVVCSCNGNCGCHYSDIRLKEEISKINPRIIDSIKPIKFKYKLPDNAKTDNRSFHYGIEAQSLLDSEIKDSGALKQDQAGFYKVDYQELIGILLAEVQDLRKEVNNLKQKNGY